MLYLSRVDNLDRYSSHSEHSSMQAKSYLVFSFQIWHRNEPVLMVPEQLRCAHLRGLCYMWKTQTSVAAGFAPHIIPFFSQG